MGLEDHIPGIDVPHSLVVIVLNISLNVPLVLAGSSRIVWMKHFYTVKCLCHKQVVGGAERKAMAKKPKSQGREGRKSVFPYDA